MFIQAIQLNNNEYKISIITSNSYLPLTLNPGTSSPSLSSDISSTIGAR